MLVAGAEQILASASTVVNITTMTCPAEQDCVCYGLTLWECLKKVPYDRYPELFSLAMGAISLPFFLAALTMVIYGIYTDPR